MSMSDQYRRRAQQARDSIAKLQADKGRHARKVADLQRQMNAASEAASRTTSLSNARSKLREVERKSRDIASTEGKIADIERKIGTEHRKLSDAQQNLAREEERESKKRLKEAERVFRKSERQMSAISSKLGEHEVLHEHTLSELESLKQLPEKIVVLFLASNPLDQKQLRLDEESRAIQEMIRKTEHRDAVKIESCWAVRPMDVMQAINEHNPHIVHFSGHGSNQDEIVFQDESGSTKRVSKQAIVQVMLACSGSIQLVFFNTCYSRDQAEAVVEHVSAAIGMNTAIGDIAARVFSSQFYSAIGFGKSVPQAFEQAKAALMLENIPEENTPELFIADGIVPEELIIVRPPDQS